MTLPAEIGQLMALESLNLISNRLESLPQEIGLLRNLKRLDLAWNRSLNSIPNEILNLPSTCVVDLTGCGLSETVRERLRAAINLPGYTGPQIQFSVVEAHHAEETRSIEESLRSLFEVAGKEQDYKSFPEITKTVDEVTFRAWLARLSFMGDYKAGGGHQKWLANRVLEHLELANQDEDFRTTFGAIINDAATTCGDRMALSVVKLGIAHDLKKINRSDVKTLADFLGRGVWAMEILEEVARNKIPSLRFVDELEVYLGYPVMLKERLRLPIDIKNMLYFRFSSLTSKDLDNAATLVKEKLADKGAYNQFLITRDVWQEALRTKYPEEYKALEIAREKAVEATDDYEQPQYDFNQGILKLTAKALE